MNNIRIESNGKLIIEDARLIFRNFEGRETPYNRGGDRNFCVLIDDPEDAAAIQDYGYNVKIRKPRDEEDEVTHYLKVNVSYKFRSPRVIMHTRKNATPMEEDSVKLLDDVDILSADMVINPYSWERPNASGVSAYLDTLHVMIQDDYFADKYADAYADEHPEE